MKRKAAKVKAKVKRRYSRNKGVRNAMYEKMRGG